MLDCNFEFMRVFLYGLVTGFTMAVIFGAMIGNNRGPGGQH